MLSSARGLDKRPPTLRQPHQIPPAQFLRGLREKSSAAPSQAPVKEPAAKETTNAQEAAAMSTKFNKNFIASRADRQPNVRFTLERRTLGGANRMSAKCH